MNYAQAGDQIEVLSGGEKKKPILGRTTSKVRRRHRAGPLNLAPQPGTPEISAGRGYNKNNRKVGIKSLASKTTSS